MTPDSINALLAALKMKQSAAGGLPMGDELPNAKPAATDNQPHVDLSLDGDTPTPDDDDDDGGTNQKIVDILQSTYPKIYAKISAMVEDEPDTTEDDPTQPDPSGGPDSAPVG